MGFILGILMGFLVAIGLLGFLAYLLCSRSNNIAVARFINGVAQALAHKPKSPAPSAPATTELHEEVPEERQAALELNGKAKSKAGAKP